MVEQQVAIWLDNDRQGIRVRVRLNREEDLTGIANKREMPQTVQGVFLIDEDQASLRIFLPRAQERRMIFNEGQVVYRFTVDADAFQFTAEKL